MKKNICTILCLTTIFLSHVFAQPDEIIYGSNTAAGKYAEVNGIKLYYESYGKGIPLIMLHGNGGSLNAFKNQIPYFEKNYRVIAVDSRLQGKSGGSPDTLSYEMMADDFCALVAYLQLDSVFVLGWSDGGINALLMAMRCPEKVKAIAISGANTVPDTSAFDVSEINGMKDFVKRKDISPIERTLNEMMIDEPNISFSSLKKIKCPVLVMAGDHDLIRPEHTIKIYQSLPHAELCIFPDSQHGVCQQHPQIFNETVDTFLKKYSR